MTNTEIIFEVHEAEEGGFWSRALGHDIFTEADTWEELKEKIRDAVECSFGKGNQLCANCEIILKN